MEPAKKILLWLTKPLRSSTALLLIVFNWQIVRRILWCNHCECKILVVHLIMSLPLGVRLVCACIAAFACECVIASVRTGVCECVHECAPACASMAVKRNIVARASLFNNSPFLNQKVVFEWKKTSPRGKQANYCTLYIFFSPSSCFYFPAAQR